MKKMKSTLDWARIYVQKGFSVIPLEPESKKPAITWKEYQTRKPTEDELRAWFKAGDKNVGIVTGKISGITVLDIDNKEAQEFVGESIFSSAPAVRTGKENGYHLYCLYQEGIKNEVNVNGVKLDIRSDGGYVVAPPSVHPSGLKYAWMKGRDIEALPFVKCPEKLIPVPQPNKTALTALYSGAAEGSRNDNLTKITGSLVSDGVPFEYCLKVINIINMSNRPPLDGQEVEGIVRSIYQRHNGTGTETVPCLLRWNEITALDVSIEYLAPGIPQNAITLLFGRGGIGKTSLCLQLAHAIAEGRHFGEFPTITTPVYYIDFENPLSVLKERVTNIGPTENVFIWHISNGTPPPRLDNPAWILYKKLPPGLIIFDTLRASHISDENDSRQMAVVIARLKELREMGFTLLLLHHTPKANENIYKGSTAILDLVDNVIGLEEVRDNGIQP